jgi:hypothetical protein
MNICSVAIDRPIKRADFRRGGLFPDSPPQGRRPEEFPELLPENLMLLLEQNSFHLSLLESD